MNILSIEMEGGFFKFGPRAAFLPKPQWLIYGCIGGLIIIRLLTFFVCHTTLFGIWASGVQRAVSTLCWFDVINLAILIFSGIKKNPNPV